jgi:hypothetical protein
MNYYNFDYRVNFQKPSYSAPLPNLNDCSITGTWSQPSMVSECNKCVEIPGYFYCGGKCMSRYDLNSVCNKNALVAKNKAQCLKPCVQQGFPSVSGGCSDQFDCNPGQRCKLDKTGRGYCI